MRLLTFLLQVFEAQGLPLSRVGRGGAGLQGRGAQSSGGGWGGNREGGQEGLTLLGAPGLDRTPSGQSIQDRPWWQPLPWARALRRSQHPCCVGQRCLGSPEEGTEAPGGAGIATASWDPRSCSDRGVTAAAPTPDPVVLLRGVPLPRHRI